MTQGLTASIVVNAGNPSDLSRTVDSVSFADEVLVKEVNPADEVLFRPASRAGTYSLASHPFLLYLADGEVVSPALRAELTALMALPAAVAAPAAYRVPRRATYLGRSVRCPAWHGEGDLRLIDRRQTSVSLSGGRILLSKGAEVGDLRGEIHWNGTLSLGSLLRDLARSPAVEGPPPPLLDLATEPVSELWRSFLRRGGVQGGGAALLLATMDSLEVLVRLARRWDAANPATPGGGR